MWEQNLPETLFSKRHPFPSISGEPGAQEARPRGRGAGGGRGLAAATGGHLDHVAPGTLRQWRTQVRLGIPAEIPTDYENLMIRLL